MYIFSNYFHMLSFSSYVRSKMIREDGSSSAAMYAAVDLSDSTYPPGHGDPRGQIFRPRPEETMNTISTI